MFSTKPVALALCVALTGCAHSSDATEAKASQGWWPFASKQEAPKKVVAMPDPKITQAWLDEYEPRLREALKGSKFELERRENLLVVTAPVDSAFNADRPNMLLPITLGPFSRIAKIVEGDKKVAVLILGHADSSGNEVRNRELSLERARAVTAIFRLSGLKGNRLMVKGFGSYLPRAANDSQEGRALNRRVEIMLTAQATMSALLAKYSEPAALPASAAIVQSEPKPVAPAKAKSTATKSKPVVAAKTTPTKVAKATPVVQKTAKSKQVVAVEPAAKQ